MFNFRRKEKTPHLDKIPNHIGIIMDGNGRWAKEKGKKETISRIVKDSFEQKRYGGIAEKLSFEVGSF